MDDQMQMRLAVVVVAALVAIAVWLFIRRRKSASLRARFGPEYDRLLQSTESPAEVERELSAPLCLQRTKGNMRDLIHRGLAEAYRQGMAITMSIPAPTSAHMGPRHQE